METSAFIVGDLQAGITRGYPFARDLVPVVSSLLPRARAAGALVVFVRTEFRANGRDVAPTNAGVSALHAANGDYHEGSSGVELDAAFDLGDGDVVVTKRRASAFVGTDLEVVLRAQGVNSLVLTGVATSAMVAATVYEGLDRDYRLTVIRDACADPDSKVHEFLVDTVFPGRGVDVTTARNWLS